MTELTLLDGRQEKPWEIVLYFDLALSAPGTIHAATAALADQAQTLTRLGSVEVIVADPTPRILLPPTRNADQLDLVRRRLATVGFGIYGSRSYVRRAGPFATVPDLARAPWIRGAFGTGANAQLLDLLNEHQLPHSVAVTTSSPTVIAKKLVVR